MNSNLVLMPIMDLLVRSMDDDVDLLLCIHTDVYLRVNTCAERVGRPSLGALNHTVHRGCARCWNGIVRL